MADREKGGEVVNADEREELELAEDPGYPPVKVESAGKNEVGALMVWVTTQVPKGLMDEADGIVDTGWGGYLDLGEYFASAIRHENDRQERSLRREIFKTPAHKLIRALRE